jgi:hypothetical protein
MTEKQVQKQDAQTQTDVHPQLEKKDYSYTWNEWELRRQAVKLVFSVLYIIVFMMLLKVDLKNKRTHSTQTTNSHLRRDNATQHYQPKENTTQTGISTSTNVTKEKRFIQPGITGQNPKMTVVTLKL